MEKFKVKAKKSYSMHLLIHPISYRKEKRYGKKTRLIISILEVYRHLLGDERWIKNFKNLDTYAVTVSRRIRSNIFMYAFEIVSVALHNLTF